MKNEEHYFYCSDQNRSFFHFKEFLFLFFILFLFFPVNYIASGIYEFGNNIQNDSILDESGSDPSSHFLILEPSLESAISKGLDYLAVRQNIDGSFGSETELFGKDPGVAALCGMAFLASGCSPGRGKYGNNIDRIIDYLLSLSITSPDVQSFQNRETQKSQVSRNEMGEEIVSTKEILSILDETDNDFYEMLQQKKFDTENFQETSETKQDAFDVYGLIARPDFLNAKPMYGHGYATLFLAECFGMSQRSDLKKKLEAAVNLIIRTQNLEGGWRYEPQQVTIADISVTTCQITALRAAKNAGFFVPDFVMDRALEYVKKCQNSDGGFRYMLIEGPSGYSRTAAAIQALQSGGQYEDNSIKKGFEYLNDVIQQFDNPDNIEKESNDFAQKPIRELPDLSKIEYYYYGVFYAALAYWIESAAAQESDLWSFWEKNMISCILQHQNPNGSWDSAASSDVSTAMILCALLVSQERLPFFVR
ncbi:MAG: terpene cyclase/mutase family protein [Planctomycetia bacterium]|nr:terpene cyclase/mutase family protein [Planctomycetia bacterium]